MRLFEGFVSYKDPELESDHLSDVLLMRQVVEAPEAHAAIIGPDSLKLADDDILVSALCVAGLDCGVPPIIKCDSQ